MEKKAKVFPVLISLLMVLAACGNGVGARKSSQDIESAIKENLSIDETTGLEYLLVTVDEGELSITFSLEEPILQSNFLSQCQEISDIVSPIVSDSGWTFRELEFTLSQGDELLLTLDTTDFTTFDYFNLKSYEKEKGVSIEDLAKIVGEATDPDDVDLILDEFCVLELDVSSPNSADGVDLLISFWDFERAIKYARFTVTPYNAVGDEVTCAIRGRSTFTAEYTGPSDTYSPVITAVETAWYNPNIRSATLDSVEIEFMDGTTLSTNDASKLLINGISRNKYGQLEIPISSLRRVVSAGLGEFGGLTKEKFISSYGTKYPDYTNYAEVIFDNSSVLTVLGLNLVVPAFPDIIGVRPIDFLYSL